MELLEYIHPFLAELDYQNPYTKLKCIGFSLVFCCVLHILSAAVSATLSKTYRSLTQKKKAYWDSYVVHGFYGLFCFVFGAWTIFYDTELLKDPVNSTNCTSHFAVLMSTGLFLYQCGCLIIFDLQKDVSTLLVVHHWASLFGYLVNVYINQGHYYVILILSITFSSPFAVVCWILLKCGKRHTVLWKVNQVVLVHAFHIRIILGYFSFFRVYQNLEVLLEKVSIFLVVFLISLMVFFHLVLTPYGIYKRTQQMFISVDCDVYKDIDTKKKVNGSCKKDS